VGKLIFWLALGVVIWWLIKRPSKDSPDAPETPGKSAKSADTPAADTERIVRCEACGVFMPESESRSLDGKIGCHDPQHCAHRVRS
jgi:hypothetical protein